MEKKRSKLLKVAGIPIGEIEIVKDENGDYLYGNVKLWRPLQGNLKIQFESGTADEELTGEGSSEDD